MKLIRPARRLHTSARYLESLSDLFVGFLFIFIIFLMLFALLLAQAQRSARAERTRLTNTTELRSQMLTSIQRSLLNHGIQVHVDESTGILRLPESLLFATGSAQLEGSRAAKLAIVAQELQKVIPCYADFSARKQHCPSNSRGILDSIFIEGHSDKVNFVGEGGEDNYDLSAKRAIATFRGLRHDSPDLDTLRNRQHQPLLGLSAYGPDRPVTLRNDAAALSENRRIDIRFIVETPALGLGSQ